MRKPKQLSFFKEGPRQFGGKLLKGNAKIRRPLSSKHAVHLVLKSEFAMGVRSMLRTENVKKVDEIIRTQAADCAVTIYHLVNVGNHLHLVVRIKEVEAYPKFIRAITGLIARHVLGAERGSAKKLQFWIARPFTRLVSWGRDWTYLNGYMIKNALQSNIRRFFASWGFDVMDEVAIVALDTA